MTHKPFRDIRLSQRMLWLREKEYRKNQNVIAEMMHISKDKLRQFEHGERPPRLDELERFCSALGVKDEERRELFALHRIAFASAQAQRSSSYTLRQTPLPLGSRETDFVPLDGTGLGDIPFSNARVQSDEAMPEVEPPPDLRGQLDVFLEHYVQDISRRKREGKLANLPHDGDIKSVCSISITRSGRDELPQWEITTRQYKYFRYMSCRKNLDTEFLYEGKVTTLRKQYLLTESFNPLQPPPFLNFLGVSLMVYLPNENCLVITKRGATEVYPHTFGASLGEVASFHKDAPGDASSTAGRGAREELGIDPPTKNLLSIGFTRNDCQYELLGYITADISFEDLRQSILMSRDGRFEVAAVYPIPATPIDEAFRALCKLTTEEKLMWPPTPLATLLLTLRRLNGDTYDQFDKSLRTNLNTSAFAVPYELLTPYLAPHIGASS